ncbi:MAG: nuclear transport factor 2 family protein [Myxococcales bacterium]|nr:nuclear transport factor 2 family protein [Myxococcales bacterium]
MTMMHVVSALARTSVRQLGPVVALLALLALLGCGNKTAKAPATSKPATQAGPKANSAPKANAKKATKIPKNQAKPKSKMPTKQETTILPDIRERHVTGLLATWVKAQNSGDFEAYSALYAERFYGTKRSGLRSRSFKRRAWLRDRKRMFGKQMRVEAKDPEVLTTAGSARLLFEQTWASGRYKDVGPKQLVIVRENGELKIAREEMLSSTVDNSGPKPKPLGPEQFGFVVHDGGVYLVLDSKPKREWADGKRLRLLQAGGYASVTSPAHTKKLPEGLKAWRGKKVVLYGPAGEVCRGQAVALSVMSRVHPHFGTVEYWRGDLKAKPDGATIAREAWRLGDSGRLLVARVMPLPGSDCRGASWGRSAELDAPVTTQRTTVDPVVAAVALRDFEKLKGFKLLQKAYVAEVQLPRALTWNKYKGAVPRVSMLANQDGTQRFVSVAVSAGDSCGDFLGELWAIWRVIGEGRATRLQLLTDDTAPGRMFVPRAAADVDGDGSYEFIGVDALQQPAGPILHESDSIEVPSLDCPC